MSVTQPSNPRCRGFALNLCFSGCVASSPPSPGLLCHCLITRVSTGKPAGLIKCKQRSQMSRPVSYMIQRCYVIAVWHSYIHQGWTGPGCCVAKQQVTGLTGVNSKGALLQQVQGAHVFLKWARLCPKCCRVDCASSIIWWWTAAPYKGAGNELFPSGISPSKAPLGLTPSAKGSAGSVDSRTFSDFCLYLFLRHSSLSVCSFAWISLNSSFFNLEKHISCPNLKLLARSSVDKLE